MSTSDNLTRYYVSFNNEKGFEELTEAEWLALMGEEPNRPYASKVYRNELTIDEVPEDLRERVQTIVSNKIARWGEYHEQPISSTELQSMIEEVI